MPLFPFLSPVVIEFSTMGRFRAKHLRQLALVCLGLAACGDEQLPQSTYLDLGLRPSNPIDAGIHADAHLSLTPDSQIIPDLGFLDAQTTNPDASQAIDQGIERGGLPSERGRRESE